MLGTAAPAPAVAGPLAPEQCAKISADMAALDQAGVKTVLERGVAAAKGTLTKDLRDQIRTYLDLLGQARFRCPSETPFVSLRPEPVDDPAEAQAAFAPIEAGTPGITLPPGVAAAVIVPPVQPVAPKAPKAATSAAGATAAAKAPAGAKAPAPAPAKTAAPKPSAAAADTGAATPAPKPKAKTNDAFKPEQPVTTPAAQPKAP